MTIMKKTGTCPKCESIEVEGPMKNKGGYGSIVLWVSKWTRATYEAYTCLDCGYSEIYPDEKGLENIREHHTYRAK